MNEVWALKHRPTMDEIVGQDDIIHAIGNGMQHMVFYSPQAGTGKTSMAHALAKRHGSTLHIFNASSKKTRGIEFVEEELLPMTRTGNWKQIFLLDEADQLTPAAQSALKGVIENAHGWFILTCNDLSKVSVWLQSRCRVYKFKPITHGGMISRLLTIQEEEKFKAPLNYLDLICKKYEGDLRGAINCLQAYYYSAEKESFIYSLVDTSFDISTFTNLVYPKNKASIQDNLSVVMDLFKGHDVKDSIRFIFKELITSDISEDNKLSLINASVISEWDMIDGVEEQIILANYIRLCLHRELYNRNSISTR